MEISIFGTIFLDTEDFLDIFFIAMNFQEDWSLNTVKHIFIKLKKTVSLFDGVENY